MYVTVHLDSFGKIAAIFFPLTVSTDVITVQSSNSIFIPWRVVVNYFTEVTVERDQPRILISALFCADDKLKEIMVGTEYDFVYDDNYKILRARHSTEVYGTYIRAFLWENFSSMIPVTAAVEHQGDTWGWHSDI